MIGRTPQEGQEKEEEEEDQAPAQHLFFGFFIGICFGLIVAYFKDYILEAGFLFPFRTDDRRYGTAFSACTPRPCSPT